MKKYGKRDILLIACVLLAAGVCFLFVSLFVKQKGAFVVVTVDGMEYGRYALAEEQEIPIIIDGMTANRLVISDNSADMIEADCPDKLCVEQRSISKTKESIVCLPHKVVVMIEGVKEEGLDAIVR